MAFTGDEKKKITFWIMQTTAEKKIKQIKAKLLKRKGNVEKKMLMAIGDV